MNSFSRLSKQLINSLEKPEQKCFNLGFGQMGISLYFYYLSRLKTNKEYEKIAKKLLDNVLENVNTIETVDIKTGLAGIGLGVDFLLKQGHLKGNVNTILGDIDDFIFRQLSFSKYYESFDAQTMMEVLYYFAVRLEAQKKGSEMEYLFREIIIKTINNAYLKLEKVPMNKHLVYNTEYELPLFLYVLNQIFSLDFYNVRITNILRELSPVLLSTFPVLHTNRLYLLWGMSVVLEQIKPEGWNDHCQLLKRALDFDKIVNDELRNQNVYFGDGATSLFLLADRLRKQFNNNEIDYFQQNLLQKIASSEVWKLMESDSDYFENHKGLYNGFCGIALLFAKVDGSFL